MKPSMYAEKYQGNTYECSINRPDFTPVFSGVGVVLVLVFCVMFGRKCLSC